MITIVGAGWSGLACAIKLTQAGQPVQLIEAAAYCGGRARHVTLGNLRVDNGQHLLIGAYRHTLELLNSIGVNEQTVFDRRKFDLDIKSHTHTLTLPGSLLPAPFNLASSVLFAKGLGITDKLRAILRSPVLDKLTRQLTVDISVAEIFTRINYPSSLVKELWSPLCLAITNSNIHETSARNFFTAINLAFNVNKHGSDLLFPKTDLSRLFPDKAVQYLKNQGAGILTNSRITRIALDSNQGHRVFTQSTDYRSKHVILTVPPYTAAKILTAMPEATNLCNQLTQFDYLPICTVYLKYPQTTTLPKPMLGLLDSTTQWIFDRQYDGQTGLLACVISGKGAHQALSSAELSHKVADEVANIFPQLPAPDISKVICEKRATFHCKPGIDLIRPDNKTNISGLWLAGDYTNTGIPATLEGAVQSGVTCAGKILAQINGSHND